MQFFIPRGVGYVQPNLPPTDITINVASVVSTIGNGATFAAITVVDGDSPSLQSLTCDNPKFTVTGISAKTGNLARSAVGTLTAGVAETVNITAVDDFGNSFTKGFSIAVTSANPAPTDITLSAATILSTAANNTDVGTLTPVDPGDTTWSYAITNGNTKFKLSASSGATSKIQRSATGTLTAGVAETVVVQVTDSASNTFTKSFTITVTATNQAPTDLLASNLSILDNAASTTAVGVLTPVDPDDTTWSFAITNGNPKFQLSAGSGASTILQRSASGTLTAGVSETVIVRVTDGSSNTFDKTLTVTVTDHTAVTTLTSVPVLSTSGSNIPANAILDLPLTFKPGDLVAGQRVRMLDAGSNVLAVEETNRVTDRDGNIRFSMVRAILPNAPGATSTTLTVQRESGTPVAGTPISVSDLLAETANNGFDVLVTLTFPDGTVGTASAREAVNAGTTWSTSASDYRGTFSDGGGGISTTHVCSAPVKVSGVADPQLRVEFHICVYKLSPGAWNVSTNPIVGGWIDVQIWNGYKKLSSMSDRAYDLKIEVGNTSKTQANFAGTADPVNLTGGAGDTRLTLSAVSGSKGITVDRLTGTWAATTTSSANGSETGKAIVEVGGTGAGYIVNRNSSTQINLIVPTSTPFTHRGSTTLASAITTTGQTSISVASAANFPSSGNFYAMIDTEIVQVTGGQGTTTWTVTRGVFGSTAATHASGAGVGIPWKKMGVYQVSQMWNAPIRVWWGTEQKINPALSSAYLQATEMFPLHWADATSATLDSSHLDLDGAHPWGIHSGEIRGFAMSENQGGDYEHIGVETYTQGNALVHWGTTADHATARSTMFKQADVGFLKPFHFRDEEHGGLLGIDDAGIYKRASIASGLEIYLTDQTGGSQWYTFALNHSGAANYYPYLLGGRLCDLQAMCQFLLDYSIRTTDSGEFKSTTVTSHSGSTFTVSGGHPLQTGEAVKVRSGGFNPTFTPNAWTNSTGNAYRVFVRRLSSTTLELYDTYANAINTGSTTGRQTQTGGSEVILVNGYGKSGIPGSAHANQARQVAWNIRTLAHVVGAFPDNIGAALIGRQWNKTNVLRYYDNVMSYCKTTWVDDSNYVASGPRFLFQQNSGWEYGPWMMDYLRLAQMLAHKVGCQSRSSSDTRSFLLWMLASPIQMATRTDITPHFFVGSYYIGNRTYNGTTNPVRYDWPGNQVEIMKRHAGDNVSHGHWQPAGFTVDIADVSDQSNITVQFKKGGVEATFFDTTVTGTGHPMVGAWIMVGSAKPYGRGQIKSVSSKGTCVIDTTVNVWDLTLNRTNTLNGAIDNATTTVVINNGAAPGSNQYIRIDSELMKVTAGAGSATMTVLRAQLGTAAAAHSNGATVQFFGDANGGQCGYPIAAGNGQNVFAPFPDATNGETIVGTEFDYPGFNPQYLLLARTGVEYAKEMGIDTGSYSAALAHFAARQLPSGVPTPTHVAASASFIKMNMKAA